MQPSYGDEREAINRAWQAAQQGQSTQSIGRIADSKEQRPSQREEAEKRVGYHRIEAERADRAAAFFREHPEFDEFIGLIRSGIVQI